MHCILRQETPCTKSAILVDILSVVVKVINPILFRSLNHHLLQALMDEANTHYSDLLSFSEVCWLHGGAILPHVCNLQQELPPAEEPLVSQSL